MNQWGHAAGEADTAIKDPEGEDYCGFAFMGYDSGTLCLPMVWRAGVMTPLPLLQEEKGKRGNNGTANAINLWDEVAGVSENTTTDTTCPPYDPSAGQSQIFEQKPVVWLHGRVQELPTIGDDPDGTALTINDNGLAAGTTGTCTAFNIDTYISVQPVHAVLWQNGRAIDLGHLAGGTSGGIALGINNLNDVVGGSNVANDTTSHGFLWTPETGKMLDLRRLVRTFSAPRSLLTTCVKRSGFCRRNLNASYVVAEGNADRPQYPGGQQLELVPDPRVQHQRQRADYRPGC